MKNLITIAIASCLIVGVWRLNSENEYIPEKFCHHEDGVFKFPPDIILDCEGSKPWHHSSWRKLNGVCHNLEPNATTSQAPDQELLQANGGCVLIIIFLLLLGGCQECSNEREAERKAKIEQDLAEEIEDAARIEAERKAEAVRIETERKAKNMKVVMQRLALFSVSEGARITETVDYLKAAEEGLRGNISGLHEVLVGVGNDPEKDHEFLSWGRMLQRLTRDRHDLERKLEDAFLASERFRLAPSDAFKTEMTGHISKGNELANEFAGRYRELMQMK